MSSCFTGCTCWNPVACRLCHKARCACRQLQHRQDAANADQCPASTGAVPPVASCQSRARPKRDQHLAGKGQPTPVPCQYQWTESSKVCQLAMAHKLQGPVTLHQDRCTGRHYSAHSKVPTGKATSLLPLVLSPTVVLMILLKPTSASLATVRSLFNSRFCSSQRAA